MISCSVDLIWSLSKLTSVLGGIPEGVGVRGGRRTKVCALKLLFYTFGLFSSQRPSRSSFHLSKL